MGLLPRERLQQTTPEPLKGSATGTFAASQGCFLKRVARTEAMDQPKRPEPEIMPPVPKTEPQRPVSETPPDEDAPQKDSPSKGED
jgi:hypothetical protein